MAVLKNSQGELTGVSLSDIDRSIRDGLPQSEKSRLDCAQKALKFYRAEFTDYPTRVKGTTREPRRYERTSPVMQRIIGTLTANLYKDGPKRTLKDHDEASDWLNNVYRRNTVDALFQEAEALSGVSDVAMFKAEPTGDPIKPIRIRLWDASQFSLWLDPEDSCKVEAVALRDSYNGQRRLRLYNDDEIWTYLTDSWDTPITSGGTHYKLRNKAPNPYGFMPFSFVHWKMPSCDFWSGGPGDHLVEVNDCTNFGLTNGFDRVRFNLNPIVKLKNVRAGWRPSAPVQPGDVWDLPGRMGDNGEDGNEPDAEYLQSDASFVIAGWEDLNSFLDLTMEMHGVPKSAVRLTQESVRSGAAIVAEQIPLILWAESRQRPFARYEDDLATLVLRMGASHLGMQSDLEYQATSAQLLEAASNLSLSLRWPKMYPDMPGQEQDIADQWLLDNHLSSRTIILMRRQGLTREEAEAHLEEIAEDLKKEQELFEFLQPVEAEQPQGKQTPAPDENKPERAEPRKQSEVDKEEKEEGEDTANDE